MINVICSVCGKEFEALKSTKKYCSTDCEKAARRIRYAEAKAAGLDPHKKGMPERRCLICDTLFVPKTGAAN